MKTINHLLPVAAIAIMSTYFDAAAASPSTAEETHLLTALQKMHPGTNFTSVTSTPIPGLYEAWMGSNMALVSKRNLRYLVFGRIFDTKTMTDLTGLKLVQAKSLQIKTEDSDSKPANTVPSVQIEQLPLNDAIKTVRGYANRTIVIFSDPACQYCKKLEPELDKLDNVTIYTFMVPFQGYALPAAIWCAEDKQKAWHQVMQGDQVPNSSTFCAHPLDRNLALAQRLKVQGTPTIFYADGNRTDGYVTTDEMEAHLALRASSIPDSAASQQEDLP